MPDLSVSSLTKRYGDQAVLQGISFSLARGECLGLLGPNGAGKTTTLRLILGLTAPSSGSIELLGEPIPQRARFARRHIGVVPQLDNLDPDFTVTENLLIYGRYFGLEDALIRARIPHLLEFADLTHKAHSRIEDLSGGMKRRLTLARALVNDPQLILLDEPTTGLDPQARHMMWQRLRRLLAAGKTILLTTHFMEEAERLCDRLIILDHGQIITDGPPRDLIAREIEPHVIEVAEADAPLQAALAPLVQRLEAAGESLFCYAADPRPLTDLLDRRQARYLQRPANLEDVFLKLTGRDLRD